MEDIYFIALSLKMFKLKCSHIDETCFLRAYWNIKPSTLGAVEMVNTSWYSGVKI